MYTINRGSCFNCAKPAGPGDYEDIGSTRLYICSEKECAKALREEIRGYEEEVRERAMQEDYERYR